MKLAPCAPALLMLAVTGCATAPPRPPPGPPPGQAITASNVVPPSARKKKVRDLLAEGDLAGAKAELQALAAELPGDHDVAVLQMEIEQDARSLLGAQYFDITVQEGDTFASLAERYVHNPDLAYALAKYNSLTLPSQPVPGQVLHMPSAPGAELARAPEPPPRPERPPAGASPARPVRKPAPAPKPAPKAADKPAAEKPAAPKPPEKPAPDKPAAEKPPEPAPAPKPAEPAPPPKPPEPAPAPKPPEPAPPPPKPPEPAPPPKPPAPAEPPKPAAPLRDPAKAAALRGQALLLMNKGDLDQAVGLLRQASALDPDSAPIKADLERAQRIQHGAK